MNKVYILIGIPCSGKSTFSATLDLPIISCDNIRQELFGKDYQHNFEDERRVWDVFRYKLTLQNSSFIIDNTNCRLKYIKEIIRCLNSEIEYKIELVYFDIPLWKANFRNIIRYFKIGKWIPFRIMKSMYNNYKNINRDEYKKCLV